MSYRRQFLVAPDRNLAISHIIVETMEKMGIKVPQPTVKYR